MTENNKQILRKCKRFAARLKSSKGVSCIDIPSSSIVLCNVGQATGFSKEELYKLIENIKDTCICKFIAEKGESHSFVVFDKPNHAETFLKTLNGVAKTKNGTLIYMNYVESVPSDEIVCTTSTPSGLHILPDFINTEEEKELLNIFDWVDEANLKNRQVKHYGYEFRYGSNDVDLESPLSNKIPPQCDILWQRLREQGFDIDVPDQLTVNKYSPGQGIPSHVDRHSPFGRTILSLSLGSDVVMDWKHHTNKYIPIVVPARSMLVMQDEARYDWQHGIQPRTWDPIIETREQETNKVTVITSDTKQRGTRISLTFRKTRNGPCECKYKTLCDRGQTNGELGNELASHLEELHVHQVYEEIAGHFSTTRHKRWPKVDEFLHSVPPGSILLDLGAGNGKNILDRNDILQIAGERSAGLLAACSQRARAQCVRLDMLRAPLRHACADVVICIAVIHHFCSEARRKKAIQTIAQLLRSGGRALITVWAKDQTKSNYLAHNKENQDTSLVTTVGGLNLPVHENRTQFQHSDLLVPWKLRKIEDNKLSKQSEETLLRYYHVFEEGELDKLCSPELVIENSFYEEGNWCVVCRKL